MIVSSFISLSFGGRLYEIRLWPEACRVTCNKLPPLSAQQPRRMHFLFTKRREPQISLAVGAL